MISILRIARWQPQPRFSPAMNRKDAAYGDHEMEQLSTEWTFEDGMSKSRLKMNRVCTAKGLAH
jgi:hypothetical protein